MLDGYARSSAALAHSLRGTVGEAEAPALAGYVEVLTRVVDPQGYPALSAALRSGAFGQAEQWVEDADFAFGLDLLLDGIQALMSKRGRTSNGRRQTSR
jgi:Tetracyclin repressor-like, C-terminal domain